MGFRGGAHGQGPVGTPREHGPAARRHRRLLSAHRYGGKHIRAACGQRRQIRVAPAFRRPHHDTDERSGEGVHRRDRRRRRVARRSGRCERLGGSPQSARTRGAIDDRRRRRRKGIALPVLRQSPEIPALRQHLHREVGGGAAHRDGAGQPQAAAAGAADVRRGRRRRHDPRARDALDARPLPDGPVLHRRQGDQSRGRPPGARENGGPLLRASVHGARHDQHVLLGVAVAAAELARRRERPRVARARALGGHRRPVRAADHGPAALPRAELDREDQQGERQSRLRAPRRARDLPRRPQAAARCRPAEAKAPCAPISTW